MVLSSEIVILETRERLVDKHSGLIVEIVLSWENTL